MTPASVANLKLRLLSPSLLDISEYASQGYLPQFDIDIMLANVVKSINKKLIELKRRNNSDHCWAACRRRNKTSSCKTSSMKLLISAKAQRRHR